MMVSLNLREGKTALLSQKERQRGVMERPMDRRLRAWLNLREEKKLCIT